MVFIQKMITNLIFNETKNTHVHFFMYNYVYEVFLKLHVLWQVPYNPKMTAISMQMRCREKIISEIFFIIVHNDHNKIKLKLY